MPCKRILIHEKEIRDVVMLKIQFLNATMTLSLARTIWRLGLLEPIGISSANFTDRQIELQKILLPDSAVLLTSVDRLALPEL